ncbi:MAG: beta-N-acetylhexosaminidase [bacterium]
MKSAICLPFLREIREDPEYGWRGIMLDESRHFFGKDKVKSILDWMVYYKLNRFHWHLTDSPGWRIEIKKYSKLGHVGGIGNHTDPYMPAQFYTQEDIKEIVAYAKERKIVVIPEIDMPGHATAANHAYPEYSGGGSERYPDWTFHPGREGTYQYLTDILREVDALFPSQMVHLGGDEVSFGNHRWKTDPEVQELMRRNNLDDLKAVENYFMRRMNDSLMKLNNHILVWDEMADAGLPKDRSVIFWWRHDQPEQLKLSLENGHKTVICPRLPFYFDFVQNEDHRFGRKWGGRFNELQDVYEFSLSGLGIDEEQRSLVLGFQGNVWTETINNEQRLDFLLYPRIAALAETVWCAEGRKDYGDFLSRLKSHLNLYRDHSIYFYNPFDENEYPEPVLMK